MEQRPPTGLQLPGEGRYHSESAHCPLWFQVLEGFKITNPPNNLPKVSSTVFTLQVSQSTEGFSKLPSVTQLVRGGLRFKARQSGMGVGLPDLANDKKNT